MSDVGFHLELALEAVLVSLAFDVSGDVSDGDAASHLLRVDVLGSGDLLLFRLLNTGSISCCPICLIKPSVLLSSVYT